LTGAQVILLLLVVGEAAISSKYVIEQLFHLLAQGFQYLQRLHRVITMGFVLLSVLKDVIELLHYGQIYG